MKSADEDHLNNQIENQLYNKVDTSLCRGQGKELVFGYEDSFNTNDKT